MSLRDTDMHVISAAITGVATAAVGALLLLWVDKAEAHRPILGDMEPIEASIAYKKTPAKQPQKKMKAPDPVVKPEGVSHDETKKVEKKPDEPKPKHKPDTPTDPFAKFHHPTDDDNEQVGKPTTDPGQFNGDQYGWAPETKGHPFWQKLAQDIHQNWEIPQILNVKGTPVGCFHITPDGKIADTKFKEKANDDALDDSVQRALDAVKKLRNENPTPVPTELLGAVTRWICFRFDTNSGG